MDDRKQVSACLERIVQAGMAGKIEVLPSLLHDDVVMAFPGFSGRAQGKAAMLGGFEDFVANAIVQAHEELDEQVDVIGDLAVGSYRFDITYSRSGASHRSTGRDLWVFRKSGDRWQAVWRTMLELVDEELPAQA
jgi:ketosteroid isomerase-like protein